MIIDYWISDAFCSRKSSVWNETRWWTILQTGHLKDNSLCVTENIIQVLSNLVKGKKYALCSISHLTDKNKNISLFLFQTGNELSFDWAFFFADNTIKKMYVNNFIT